MTEVISVRFRGGCKSYFFDPNELKVKEETAVIVETAQGIEYGICAEGNHMVPDDAVVQPLRKVIRIATENDKNTVEYNRKRERDAFDICERKIAEHGLEMKLVRVEYGFDGNKILFFFTADGRVDFRELVKNLASIFHARIELRQIGVRDETKMLGGLGICGRPLCCSDFLNDFIPVSIKMAKTQNLSLNPTKISGACGRLMCCLKYEQDAYEDAAKRMPKNDSFVQTPDGVGDVCELNYLKEEVKVKLDDAPETPRVFQNCEVCVLRNGKGSREGIAIPSERPTRQNRKPSMDEPAFLGRNLTGTYFEPETLPEKEEVPTEKKEERKGKRDRRKPHKKVHAEKAASSEESMEIRSVTEQNPSMINHAERKVTVVKAGEGGEKKRHRPFYRKNRRSGGKQRNNNNNNKKEE